MCGALAISPPSASKIAQEKSSRSLMLTECAVPRSRTPICSATDMNRLLKISSSTGSTSVPGGLPVTARATRVSSRSPRPVTSADQPGSTTVVAKSSAISAGPATRCPGPRSRRLASGASRHCPAAYIGTDALAAGDRAVGRACRDRGVRAARDAAVSSTETASTTTVRSRIRNEKCCR